MRNDLINSGVDVVYLSGIDTTEAITVAGQRADRGDNVWAIPYDYEGACDIKPEICLGTPYFNWGPTYVRLIERARDGKHEPTWEWEAPYWKDINDVDKTNVGFIQGDALTADQKASLDAYIAEPRQRRCQDIRRPAQPARWNALSGRRCRGHRRSDLVSASASRGNGRREFLS